MAAPSADGPLDGNPGTLSPQSSLSSSINLRKVSEVGPGLSNGGEPRPLSPSGRYIPFTTQKVTVIQRSSPLTIATTTGMASGQGGGCNSSVLLGDFASAAEGKFGAPTSKGLLATVQALSVHEGVNNLRSTCDREKRDMKELNERLAGYIDKVHSSMT